MYRRCGHFSITPEEIGVPGVPVRLRIPIRRCVLAERMLTLLAQTEQGRAVTDKLTIDPAGTRRGEDTRAEEPLRAAFGPDLEPIHAQECTVERCQASCSPSFKLLLAQFGYQEEADAETGTGCIEVTLENIVPVP